MPTVLRFRRGDTTASNAFTGAEGELFVDTSKDTVVVHDGVTAGGKPLATEAALTTGLASKVNSSSLATVATSGSYNDLTDKPSIPSLTGYATETYVNNGLSGKQTTLVSGTNIKTVNGTSILGSGNITISGGSGGSADLTQVSSDITPLFDGVYDIGSSTNRFYDAYLGNKLDINGATVSGSVTGSEGSSTTSSSPVSGTVTSAMVNNISVIYNHDQFITTLYPAGTNFIAVGIIGSNLVQQIPTGAAIQLYNESNTLVSTTVTIGTAFIHPLNNQLVLIPVSATDIPFLGMSGGTRFSYSGIATITTVIPDTREYTLASNASLVAPEVIADVALLGTTLIEADTITPEHILGAYSDQKGTLIVDGSLKVNDDLSVRNKIALKQEEVEIGKVVSFGTAIGTKETTYASTISWQSYFKDPYTMGGMGGNSFYSYPAYLYWSQTDLTASATASSWVAGNTIKITSGGYWWKFTITAVAFTGMGTQIDVTEIATSAPQSLYAQGSYGMSNFGQSGVATFPADIALSSVGTVNTVELDNSAIPLVVGNKLLVNGSAATTPVPNTLNLSGSLSSFGIQNYGSQPGYPDQRYLEVFSDWNTTTTPNLVKIKSIFTNGNDVSIVYGGQIGVYKVSGVTISNGMYGTNTRYGFTLTFFSGTDFAQSGNFGYAMGDMSQPVNWNTVVQVSTNYSSYIGSFNAAVSTTYQSSSSWDWLNVGDVLSYIPNSTSIQFAKDDGTSVKAITYDNNTGSIAYDGIKSLIGDKVSVSTLYSDTNVGASTKSASQTTVYGYGSYGGNNSVAIGYSTGSGSSAANPSDYGTAVGSNTRAMYSGVAIGGQSVADQYSLALGTNAVANGANCTAIGTQSYIGSGALGVTAWGGTHANSVRHQLYTWTHHGVLNTTGTFYLSTNPNYYAPQTYRQIEMGMNLPAILGNSDSLARLRITAFFRKPSWAGAGDNWNISTQEYVIANTSSGVYTLTPVGSLTTVAECGNGSWNGNHSPSLEIDGNYLYAKVQKMNTEYAQSAIKIEMQSATWSLN